MSLSLAPSTVALETNLARKGFVALGAATDAEFEGTDLLGHIRINRRLRPVDLEVLAWLSAAFRAEDPLDRKRDPSVRFSRSRLAHDLFARVPGGKERRIVTESLERLAAARVDFDGYDARLGKLARFEGVGLLDWVESSAGRRCGAALAPWLRAQLEAEYVTFLDWEIMRSLRGLAKRLWIYLEAEQYRKRTIFSPRRAWLAMSKRTWVTLGTDFRQEAHAKAALQDAARRIIRADPKYSFAVVSHGRGQRLQIRVIPHYPDRLRARRAGVDQLTLDLLDTPDPDFPIRSVGFETGNLRLVREWRNNFAAYLSSDFRRGFSVVFDGNRHAVLHSAGCSELQRAARVALSMYGDLVLSAPHRADLSAWLERACVAEPTECRACRPPLIDPADPATELSENPYLSGADEPDIPF